MKKGIIFCLDSNELKAQTLKSALQAMLDGKKVRNTNWGKCCYILFDGKTFVDDIGEHLTFERIISYNSTWELSTKSQNKK